MSNVFLKLKVWTKVVVFAALLVYVITFVAQNSSKPVQPWFWFKTEPETTLLVLVLAAFAAGIVCAILFRTTFATLRQIRDLRERNRATRMEREVDDMRTKAAMVRTRPGPEDTGADLVP